jgi:hypothetical protein
MKKIAVFILTFGLIGWFGSVSFAQTVTPTTVSTPQALANVVGTGSVTQTIHTWAEISVKEAPYNAFGDGVHNDTAAIQAAINTAATGTFGNTVFLPTGAYSFTQLKMQTGVILKGSGWGTELLQATGSNEDAIILANTSVQWTVLQDFYLDGGNNRGNTSGDGIDFINTGGTFIVGDPVHKIEHLMINNIAGNGVAFDANVRGSVVENVYVNGANNNGYLAGGTDNDFINCITGSSGANGFEVATDNSRFIGCKAFGAGRLQGINGSGDGWACGGARNEYSACEAQDCRNDGFDVECNNSAFTSCRADSNSVSYYSNEDSGFLLRNASANILEGCASFDTFSTQAYGLGVIGTCNANRVSMQCNSNLQDPFQNLGAGYPGTDDIRLNNQDGIQTLSYAVTITPEPYLGGTASVTLAGNAVINVPPNNISIGSNNHQPGCPLTLRMIQDNTGGRAVTWGHGYVINNFSPNTGANQTNTIKFIYDGTNWNEVSDLI